MASLAGVSISTVSNVVNRSRPVSDEARARVEKAIDTLNYIPDISAQAIKTGRKRCIGFVVPDIANMFFASMIEAIEDTLAAKGYNLIVVNTKETPAREVDAIRTLTSGLVDALIIAPTNHDKEVFETYIPASFPVILVDRRIPEYERDMILISSHSAVYEGVTRLIEMGHTKIGYIAGMRHLSTTVERLGAYKSALHDRGLKPDEGMVRYANSMFNSANQCMPDLLAAECTALVVSNSIMTTDALNYLNNHSPEKRGEIAVIGFSDSRFDEHIHPSLSVVRQPTIQMAKKAAEQILYRIKNPNSATKEIILYSTFLERNL